MNVLDRFNEMLREYGVDMNRIWTCQCGQKNRVDTAKIVTSAARAKCGKCGSVLKYEEPKADGRASGG